MFKTSLQTMTWGDPQSHLFDHIFELAAETGFAGLEISYRRLSAIGVGDVEVLLDKYGLVINASHIGGNLADLDQAAGEGTELDETLNRLFALKIPYLLYSGLNETDDAALESGIIALNRAAIRCAERGVELLYHNHHWEFAAERRIWNRLLDDADPSIGFAPDLGWIAWAGEDPATILSDLNERVKILHFKDFGSSAEGENTCHLGTGIVDFEPAWKWLSERSNRDIWVTAEQDKADDADAACIANGAYLNNRIIAMDRNP